MMENSTEHPLSISKINNIIFDLLALLAIYLVPAISHYLSFPIYYLEPMRIMLILAIVHTNRRNVYLIALTLPVFSLLISAHPSLIKTLLITGELFLNVWLYFLLTDQKLNKVLSISLSIILSKIVYYLLKLMLVNFSLLNGDLVSTPVYFQALVVFILTT